MLAASLVLAAGLIYQDRLLGAGGQDIAHTERQLAAARAAAEKLRTESLRVATDLSAASQRLGAARDRAKADATTEAALEAWLARVAQLKQWFADRPNQAIPEMRYLTSSDWLTATLDNDLHHPGHVRLAAADIRRVAKFRTEISNNLSQALVAYRRDHNGTEAATMADLQPYLSPALSDDILLRYEFRPPNTDGWKGSSIILQERGLPDEDFDVQIFFGQNGSTGNRNDSPVGAALGPAYRGFQAANPNGAVTELEQLRPYLPPNIDPERVQAYWDALKR